MQIDTQEIGTATVVTITGDVGPMDTDRLSSQLIDGAATTAGPLIVDLTGVTSMDPGGLEVMSAAREATSGSGRDIRLVMTAGRSRTLFRSGAVLETFEVYHSMQDAVDRVAQVTTEPAAVVGE